jgi:hypothetical protein
LPAGKTGGDVVKAEQTAKLSLPKVDLPKSTATAPRIPVAGDIPKLGDRANTSPLPRGDGNPRGDANPRGGNNPRGGIDRQNTSVLPQNSLPDAGKSSRSPFGAKTDETPRLPGQTDNPRLPNREPTNRDLKTKDSRGGGDNINKGRSGIESPSRGNEIPSLPPDIRADGKSGPSRERTNGPTPGQPGFTPGNNPAGKAPTFTPRDSKAQSIVPPIGSRDRGAQRGDQPTIQGSGPKTGGQGASPKPGGGNINSPPPQPQPPRGSGRQEGGGSSNENSKKGKGRG